MCAPGRRNCLRGMADAWSGYDARRLLQHDERLSRLWPGSGRMEVIRRLRRYVPDLRERGANDGVRDLYQRMFDRGELAVYAGRVTPVGRIPEGLAPSGLKGERIVAVGRRPFPQGGSRCRRSKRRACGGRWSGADRVRMRGRGRIA